MPFSWISWPSTRTRSSSVTPFSSAASAAVDTTRRSSNLEAILDTAGPEGRARAARGMALHVHRYGVHRDVRRRCLDVHREGGRIAAQALRPDAEHIHRLRELALELRALRVGALRAEGPRRSLLGEVQAEIGGAADADADDGRRAGLAARLEHAVDDEGLDRIDALSRHRHAQPGIVFRPGALGDHLDHQRLVVRKIDVDHRHASTRRGLLVDARGRMHDRGAERVLARRARTAAADRVLQSGAVHLDAAADAHVVDRDAGVLAQQVVGLLGDRDVVDHGAEHAPRERVALALLERVEALLDVRWKDLQRANVELLRRLLDLAQIDFHLTRILRSLTTRAQSAVSSFIARASSSGVLPTGARPCT